ncbi:transglutaminase-like cysteine peptidase [Roseovarius sp. EL26]|uniref:transglutaminase-like cysteine peptidase n=1 Tax=Roseovarius sp. EL26 TaxID=2126672 RepID=UPI000EA3BA48|nr:transglutaminase-like cysteine peptidase [Roseovarius sp. EL26]
MTIAIESNEANAEETRLTAVICSSMRFVKAAVRITACAIVPMLFATQSVNADTSNRIQPKRQMAAPSGAVELCSRYAWACATSSGGAKISSLQIPAVQKINRRINQSVRSVPDQRQYRTKDVWALPTRTGGDCEDYALAKKLKLVQMGYAPEELLIATVVHKKLGPHAVLVIRTEQGDYVLDNLTNRVLLWKETNYFFVQMQNPQNPKQWVGVFLG